MKGLTVMKRTSRALIAIILTCCMMAACFIGVSGCSSRSTSTRRPSSSSQTQTKETGDTVTAVLTLVDTESKNMRFRTVDNYEDVLCSYNVGISVISKSGEVISASQLIEGMVCDITYDTEDRIISKVRVSTNDDVWEQRNVSNFSVDETAHEITIGKTLYTYDEKTIVFSHDKEISILELNRMDSLTVRGYKHEVVSIIVDTGHGYVSLTNASLFYGGLLDIGGLVVKSIEPNMVITVTEGTYKLEAESGEYSTTKTITVNRDELTLVSFGDVRPNVTQTGNVKFDINIDNAKLYIDNVLRDADGILTLTVGSHTVVITADGYNDYKDTISVVSGYTEYSIDMEDEEETTYEGETTTGEEETTTTVVNGETIVSTTNTVTVQGPEGAAIYFDSSYKGIAPVTFAMITGTHNITVLNGTDIATYTVNLVEGADDVLLDFSQY